MSGRWYVQNEEHDCGMCTAHGMDSATVKIAGMEAACICGWTPFDRYTLAHHLQDMRDGEIQMGITESCVNMVPLD